MALPNFDEIFPDCHVTSAFKAVFQMTEQRARENSALNSKNLASSFKDDKYSPHLKYESLFNASSTKRIKKRLDFTTSNHDIIFRNCSHAYVKYGSRHLENDQKVQYTMCCIWHALSLRMTELGTLKFNSSRRNLLHFSALSSMHSISPL